MAALTKNFLSKSPPIELGKTRLVVGIVLGLFYAFYFYSFLYICREAFRFFSINEDYDIFILSDSEVNFYNLIFAFLAVVIGQSITFRFWLERPKQIREKRYFHRVSMVNDQRVLHWSFLNFSSRLALVIGILLISFPGGLYYFNFSDHKYVIVLAITMLFLQSWNTIRLIYKRKSFKWMLSTMAFLSLIAFGLSRINLIDYKAFNQHFLEKNIHYRYQFTIPQTDCYTKIGHKSLMNNIYVMPSEDSILIKPQIITGFIENKITLEGIALHIEICRQKVPTSLHYRMAYVFYIHQDIKMEFINQVKNEFLKSNVKNIYFAVIPKQREHDIRYYKDLGFKHRMTNWQSDLIKEDLEILKNDKNKFKIKQDVYGKYYINDQFVEANQIKNTLRSLLLDCPNCLMEYHVNDQLTFADYFKVINSKREITVELRNEYSLKNYGKEYEFLKREDKMKVRREYPEFIIEVTSIFWDLVE